MNVDYQMHYGTRACLHSLDELEQGCRFETCMVLEKLLSCETGLLLALSFILNLSHQPLHFSVVELL